MHPIWTLYSRRIFSRLAFWLSALGFNARDRSLTNRIYLVYFIIFWAVWVGAVFALFASTLAGGLQHVSTPAFQVISTSFQIILLGWVMIQLWSVTHRSPFSFSEEDAYLICQMPVNRRRVGFVLYLQGWLSSMLPFLAGVTVLAFTVEEVSLLQAQESFVLGRYILSSFRGASIILPLHSGLLGLLWALGALRLYPRPRQWLGFIPLGVLLLGATVFGLRAHVPLLYSILHFPLQLVVDATFATGAGPWLAGFTFALLLLILGMLSLFLATPHISLAQAARETSLRASIHSARDLGVHILTDAMRLRKCLGIERTPSCLLSTPGAAVLFEKDEVQTRRSLTIGFFLHLAWIFGLCLGMFFSPGWQVKLILGAIWALAVGLLLTRRLRSDLARWWILRSLPVKATTLLRLEIRLPWTLVVWIGWLCAFGSPAQLGLKLLAVAMIPFLAASAGFAVASDILGRCQARTIMSPSIAEENIPTLDIKGALLSIACVLVPYGMLLTLAAHPAQAELGIIALALSIALTWLTHRSAGYAFTNVR